MDPELQMIASTKTVKTPSVDSLSTKRKGFMISEDPKQRKLTPPTEPQL